MRDEEGQDYTILSDSTAALERAASDEMGPGQRSAVAIVEVHSRLGGRGNTTTLGWVLGHLGVDGKGPQMVTFAAYVGHRGPTGSEPRRR